MKRQHLFFGLLLATSLALVLTIGCGSDDTTAPPTGNATEATIGTGGGTLNRTGEASLAIPAGALVGDVDFSMDEDATPTALTTDRDFATPVFTIGPDGTQFASPATLTLNYDEADLDGADESTIVMYSNDGNGWVPLTTTVDEGNNTASAQINHLSDYCATIPYGEPADGVYAILEVTRAINDLGFINRTDMITARFDTIVDPCNVHHALHPDSVKCDAYKLAWDGMFSTYMDTETAQEFLVLGHEYEFEVFGNDEVPDLVQSITFPDAEPYMTNITHEQVLPLSGFSVEWTGTGAGNVQLVLTTSNEQIEIVSVLTENDGEHTFTADDLASIETGVYALILYYSNLEYIEGEGYDPYGSISAGTMNLTLINLASDDGSIGPAGGVLQLGDDGHLTIRSGALTNNVDFTATVNTSPTAAPEGWAFMTPVYTIEPTGTTFAIDAELHFDYDEADLNGGDESSIVIFTDTGSGWTQLASDVFETFDWVTADIDHLSNFVAMVEVDVPAEGIYCELLVRRVMSYYEPIVTSLEDVTVRFDAAVGPEPSAPADCDSVTFNGMRTEWDSYNEYYDLIISPLDPLHLGQDYTFVVYGDVDVPDLTQVVTFISYAPYVTNMGGYPPPEFPLTGFDVEWGGDGGGTVHLTIYDIDDEIVFTTETDNDGLYSVTPGDLMGLSAGMFGLELSCIVTDNITAPGYDPNSFWKTCSYNYNLFNLVD